MLSRTSIDAILDVEPGLAVTGTAAAAVPEDWLEVVAAAEAGVGGLVAPIGIGAPESVTAGVEATWEGVAAGAAAVVAAVSDGAALAILPASLDAVAGTVGSAQPAAHRQKTMTSPVRQIADFMMNSR